MIVIIIELFFLFVNIVDDGHESLSSVILYEINLNDEN